MDVISQDVELKSIGHFINTRGGGAGEATLMDAMCGWSCLVSGQSWPCHVEIDPPLPCTALQPDCIVPMPYYTSPCSVQVLQKRKKKVLTGLRPSWMGFQRAVIRQQRKKSKNGFGRSNGAGGACSVTSWIGTESESHRRSNIVPALVLTPLVRSLAPISVVVGVYKPFRHPYEQMRGLETSYFWC